MFKGRTCWKCCMFECHRWQNCFSWSNSWRGSLIYVKLLKKKCLPCWGLAEKIETVWTSAKPGYEICKRHTWAKPEVDAAVHLTLTYTAAINSTSILWVEEGNELLSDTGLHLNNKKKKLETKPVLQDSPNIRKNKDDLAPVGKKALSLSSCYMCVRSPLRCPLSLFSQLL